MDLQLRCKSLCSAGLVVLAGGLNPIPFRTRPLNPPAPMVLHLKMRESRSLPGLPNTGTQSKPLHEPFSLHTSLDAPRGRPSPLSTSGLCRIRRDHRHSLASGKPTRPAQPAEGARPTQIPSAGWSSPVARQAHNLKVVSSNLAPATTDARLFASSAKGLGGGLLTRSGTVQPDARHTS